MVFRALVIAFGILFALAAVASASPVSVSNFSFETLPVGGLPLTSGCDGSPGCAYSVAAIPGWTNTGFSGQWQPGSSTVFFNSIPDGTTAAYSNDAAISQSVGTVAANTTYTLLVDIGLRKDEPNSLATVQLLVGGASVNAIGVAPTVGNWSTFTATYNSVAADVGKTLTIQLTTVTAQGDFDNVRLDASPTGAVPEPTTITLLGAGIALLAFWGRKSQRTFATRK